MNTQFTMAPAPASALQSSTQSPPPPLPITVDEINALHAEFRRCGKNAREWTRQCQMMLPKIRDEEVWKKKGYDSIYDYARILAGMSRNSVDDALWIMDKIANKPELQEIAKEKGLSAVRPVVAIATEETSQFWAEKASDMSQNTLKIYVRNSRENLFLDSRVNPSQRVASQDGDMSNTRRDEGLRCEIRREATNGEFCLGDSGDCEVSEEGSDTAGDKKTASVYMKLEVEVIEKLKRMKGDRDWNELMKDLLRERMVKEGCAEGRVGMSVGVTERADSGTEEKPAPVNTGKRYVPVKIKRHVVQQTSGLCAYPGCTRPYEILHHTKRFAIDGAHDPDTLKPLCKAHERLAHGGLIESEEKCPVNWSLLAEPDTRNPKYEIDKKTNEHYMPKLE